MVVGVVVVALGWVVVVRLLGGGGWGSVGGGIGLIFSPTCVHMYFFFNLVKKIDSGWSYTKNIFFSLPIPKIKFNPPPTRVKCFGVYILVPSLNQQIF